MPRSARWEGDLGWRTPREGPLRVVVEDADGAAPWAWRRVLERAGYMVATCGGPDANGGMCRLVDTGRCELVEGADVILYNLNASHAANASVLDVLRERAAHVPTIVVMPEPDIPRHRERLLGCVVLLAPPTASAVVDAVARARHR